MPVRRVMVLHGEMHHKRVFPAPLGSVRAGSDWQQTDFIYSAPGMHNMTRYLTTVLLQK